MAKKPALAMLPLFQFTPDC